MSGHPLRGMLLIVTALPEESRPIAAALGLERELRMAARPPDGSHGPAVSARWRLAGRGSLWLLETGPGPQRAAEATRFALHHLPQVDVVLALGFAGGLDPALPSGALVLGRPVIDGTAGGPPPSSAAPDIPDPDLAARLSPPAHAGGLVSVSRVLATAAEKQAARARFGAIAVDMESASVAREARARGVRFAAVRAITDTADQDLPLDFNQYLDEAGGVDRARIVAACLARPSRIPALVALGRRSAAAGAALGRLAAALAHDLGR